MAMPPRALAIVLLALTTAVPAATSDARAQVAEDGYILAECHQAAPPSASASNASIAFRARLHALLVDLPSATDPTGFASLHSDNGGPFVRGLCFDDDSLPTGGCAACLTAAAKKIADECGGSRRAGVWSAGCFVAYADTNFSSPHEDAYRGWNFSADGVTHFPAFYDAVELTDLARSLAPRAANSSSGRPMTATANMTTGGNGKVRATAQCARDVTAADCAWCLEQSAMELLERGWVLDGSHEGVVVVAGFNCHLRLEIRAPAEQPELPLGKRLAKWIKDNVAVFVVICLEVVGIVVLICLCIRKEQ